MNIISFDQIIDRRNTASMKWDKYKDRDVIPLWVADMDFQSPPEVLDALHRRVDHGVFGYTIPPDDLIEAAQERLRSLYDWHVERDWIVWLPGLVSGINITCRAVGGKGDAVLTHVPAYPPFLHAPGHFGQELNTVPLIQSDTGWMMDWEATASAVSARARLFLLCSPHNPTGRLWTREELERVADFCVQNDLILCSDEIHSDLLLDRDRPHIPTAALGADIADRTITLMAPSKTYNIAGLNCSFAVIPNDALRQRFLRAMDGIVPHVNALGYTAALAAYRHGDDWLASVLEYLRGNRDVLRMAVDAMAGLSMPDVEATYLAWIDARGAGLDDPAAFFEAAGVGLSDGRDFGMAGFVRLNFGCPRSRLESALSRMQQALQDRSTIEIKGSAR